MRKLINYFRQCFCKHSWQIEEIIIKEHNDGWGRTRYNHPRISATCKKCGYHKSYWKF